MKNLFLLLSLFFCGCATNFYCCVACDENQCECERRRMKCWCDTASCLCKFDPCCKNLKKYEILQQSLRSASKKY